jgi:hypothetical protein
MLMRQAWLLPFIFIFLSCSTSSQLPKPEELTGWYKCMDTTRHEYIGIYSTIPYISSNLTLRFIHKYNGVETNGWWHAYQERCWTDDPNAPLCWCTVDFFGWDSTHRDKVAHATFINGDHHRIELNLIPDSSLKFERIVPR